MSTSKVKSGSHRKPADTRQAVDDFMAELTHPLKAEIQALRVAIIEADPAISEGIKWNAPSFRVAEYFATIHLRAKTGIGLILHLGAKVRDVPVGGILIDDPDKLLTWVAKDRATIVFEGLGQIEARKSSLQGVLRQWLQHL